MNDDPQPQVLFTFAMCDRPSHNRLPLGSSNVLSLPPLRSLCDLKLHFLAFLQALEAARLDSREVHENVFAILAADKTVAFGGVKPLYCTLFHFTGFSAGTGLPSHKVVLSPFALYLRSVCTSNIAFRGLRCHPPTCMSLKLRLAVDSIPSALTVRN